MGKALTVTRVLWGSDFTRRRERPLLGDGWEGEACKDFESLPTEPFPAAADPAAASSCGEGARGKPNPLVVFVWLSAIVLMLGCIAAAAKPPTQGQSVGTSSSPAVK